MTIQTLSSNSFIELAASADSDRHAASSNASGSSVCLLGQRQPLYQGSHQTELQHLQAEAEALLQQLQALKQQRLASTRQII
jgi:hypothetical protein